MKEFICEECGKPLKYIAPLTDSEVKNFIYINTSEEKVSLFIDKLLYESSISYRLEFVLKRLYIRLAKVKIAKIKFFNELRKTYNIAKDVDIYIRDLEIYIHE